MGKEPPQVQYHEEIHVRGSFGGVLSAYPDPVVSIVIPAYEYPCNISFTSHFRDVDSFELVSRLQDQPGDVEFSGEDESGQPVRFEGQWNRSTGNVLHGRINFLDQGVVDLPELPGKQVMIARFSPTSLALPEIQSPTHYWTGEIRAGADDKKRPPFSLETVLGTCEFSLHYTYEKVRVGTEEANVRIPVPTIKLTLEQTKTNTGDLLEKFQEEIAPFERVTSFLSRRHVRLSRVEVHSSRFPSENWLHEATRLMRGHSSPAPRSPFVWAPKLAPSSLSILTQTYLNSAYKEILSLVIDYLIPRWRGDTLETLATTAFTAFETLVNGISEADGAAKSLSDPDFGELRKHLEEQIRAFAKSRGISGPVRGDLYAKLKELQRRSIIPRAVELVRRYNVEWVDLFKGASSLEKALGEAYTRRSKLIHAGKVSDYGTLFADTNRIHALTERIVFNMLGGDQSWIFANAFSHVV